MSLPTVEITKRIANMMHRKLSTHWSEKEFKQYRKLYKDHCFDDSDDLALLERYYAFERKRGEHGRHRRDLITLLNNWQGELDRATAWNELHPMKSPPRKIIPMPPVKSEPFEPTPSEIESMARVEAARKLRKPQTFQDVKAIMQ